jgi:hypothetical protein
MTDARLLAALHPHFVLQFLDELGNVRVSPGQNIADDRPPRHTTILQLRNRQHCAANSIESNHGFPSPRLP